MPDRRSSKGGPRDGDDKGKQNEAAGAGSALRSAYHEIVSEPVPDEMLDLLRKLD